MYVVSRAMRAMAALGRSHDASRAVGLSAVVAVTLLAVAIASSAARTAEGTEHSQPTGGTGPQEDRRASAELALGALIKEWPLEEREWAVVKPHAVSVALQCEQARSCSEAWLRALRLNIGRASLRFEANEREALRWVKGALRGTEPCHEWAWGDDTGNGDVNETLARFGERMHLVRTRQAASAHTVSRATESVPAMAQSVFGGIVAAHVARGTHPLEEMQLEIGSALHALWCAGTWYTHTVRELIEQRGAVGAIADAVHSADEALRQLHLLCFHVSMGARVDMSHLDAAAQGMVRGCRDGDTEELFARRRVVALHEGMRHLHTSGRAVEEVPLRMWAQLQLRLASAVIELADHRLFTHDQPHDAHALYAAALPVYAAVFPLGRWDRADAEIRHSIARCRASAAACADAIAVARGVVEEWSRGVGAESARTLELRHNAAVLLRDAGDIHAAAVEMEDVHRLRSAVLGEPHPATLQSQRVLWRLKSEI